MSFFYCNLCIITIYIFLQLVFNHIFLYVIIFCHNLYFIGTCVLSQFVFHPILHFITIAEVQIKKTIDWKIWKTLYLCTFSREETDDTDFTDYTYDTYDTDDTDDKYDTYVTYDTDYTDDIDDTDDTDDTDDRDDKDDNFPLFFLYFSATFPILFSFFCFIWFVFSFLFRGYFCTFWSFL